MKKLKKIISLTMALLSLCAFVVSCRRGGDEGTITLTVWGAQEDQAMLKEMCEAYAKANPDKNYKFLYGVQGENEASDRILSDPTAGPDVYSFAGDQLSKLFAGGALARVGGEIEAAVKEANTEVSVKAASLTIGGQEQLYAYPATGDNCCFIYYDKRVYPNAEDLSSLDRMLELAEAAGKKIHYRLNNDGWYLSTFFFAEPELKYEVTYNDNMVEQSVDINYNAPRGLAVMQALRGYIGRTGLVAETDDSKILAAFAPNAQGKVEAAAVVTGTWNAAAIKAQLGENMGVCKLPTATIGDEQKQLSGFMGYKFIGVNGYSKQTGEAHKLALWLTNEQNQQKRYETRGFGPTNKKVSESEAVQSDPVMKAVFDQAPHNRAQTGVPTTYWTPMASLVTPLINAYAEGTTVTDAQLQQYLDACCKQIKVEKK